MSAQSKTARPLGETGGAATSNVAPVFFEPVHFDIPCPPSVNNAFFNVTDRRGNSRGRQLKRKVRDWLDYTLRLIADQYSGEPITVPVLIVVNVERGSARADIDNRIKLLFDALIKGGVIEDDSLVSGFSAAWAEPGTRRARLAILPVHKLQVTFHPSARKNGACGGWFFEAPTSTLEEEEAA